MTPVPAPAEAFYLTGTAGKLFCIYQPGGGTPRRDVLIVPPFAEEMNRSRRMFTLQARALAARGVGTMLVDLYGTGDSAGDFSDARWEIWRHDVLTSLTWLRAQGAQQIAVLGVRLGALLALDTLRKDGGECEPLLMWQPVVNGEAFVTQFLRVRLAASMLDSAKERESTQDLRAQLGTGNSVEVAGYELTPALAAAIDSLRLERLRPDLRSVYWFDLAMTPGASPAPASQRIIDDWKRQGVHVVFATVAGAAFWSTIEISLAPALLKATADVWSSETKG